ncbi:sulfurtransferase TusA family protein [Photobacterium aquae]|nr:sulfurtransferase TusA family protein [Photobacterium aquae]
MLDLTKERCPMALLLAKRAAESLSPGDALAILIIDTGARQDIPRYFSSTRNFSLNTLEDSPHRLLITVTKRL